MEKRISRRSWKSMTLEEKRALMPKRLSKLGEWIFDPNRERITYHINDMRAVLK